MSVTDTVRHGSKQLIYEGYPELGYNYRLTDLQAAIGVSNCNGFSHSSRGGGSLRRNMVSAFATSPNWKRLPSLAGLAATGKAIV